MDVETKEAARRKAHGITEHIGYPSELTDKTKLEELYRGLELNSTHFLGNALNMTVFGTNYAFSKLREKASCILVHKPDYCTRKASRTTLSLSSLLSFGPPFGKRMLEIILWHTQKKIIAQKC